MKLKRYMILIVPLMSFGFSTQSSAQWIDEFIGGDKKELVTGKLHVKNPRQMTDVKKGQGEKGSKSSLILKGQDRASKLQTQRIGAAKQPLASVPVPKPRPWGSADAADDVTASIVAKPETRPIKLGMQFLFIARHEFKGDDIGSMRIAVRPNAEALVSEVIKRLKTAPIQIGWSQGLVELAHGGVDAVLITSLSVDTPPFDEFIDPYRLVAIPAYSAP